MAQNKKKYAFLIKEANHNKDSHVILNKNALINTPNDIYDLTIRIKDSQKDDQHEVIHSSFQLLSNITFGLFSISGYDSSKFEFEFKEENCSISEEKKDITFDMHVLKKFIP